MVLKPLHSLKVNFFILKYKKKYLCLSNDTVETIYMFDTPVPNQDLLILPLSDPKNMFVIIKRTSKPEKLNLKIYLHNSLSNLKKFYHLVYIFSFCRVWIN